MANDGYGSKMKSYSDRKGGNTGKRVIKGDADAGEAAKNQMRRSTSMKGVGIGYQPSKGYKN